METNRFTEFKVTFILYDSTHLVVFLTTDLTDFKDKWGEIKDEVVEQLAVDAVEQVERNHGFLVKEWNDIICEVNYQFYGNP